MWRKRWQLLFQTDPNMNFEDLKRLTQTNLSQPGRVGIAHHFVPHTRCWDLYCLILPDGCLLAGNAGPTWLIITNQDATPNIRRHQISDFYPPIFAEKKILDNKNNISYKVVNFPPPFFKRGNRRICSSIPPILA